MIKIIIVLLFGMLVLYACGGKPVSRNKEQAVLHYMQEKYEDNFIVKEIFYERAKGDPMIPWPYFLEPFSDNITAKVESKKNHGQTAMVHFDAATNLFTDDLHDEEIARNLLYYVYENEMSQIEQVFEFRVLSEEPWRRRDIIYPKGKDGFYDLKAQQNTYAYEYLKEHEVGIYASDASDILNPAVKIFCAPKETDEIIPALDKLFWELFDSKDTEALILFYYTEDGRTEEEVTTRDCYLQLSYVQGFKTIKESIPESNGKWKTTYSEAREKQYK